uniref:Uncharacterized protein n=1 Tax=Setaria viridis TaxID=4556 RepID=A0A4U6WHP4_SETVI|nr:hypothetical protein SEVIR_1G331300v2 [Setaria viridis]
MAGHHRLAPLLPPPSPSRLTPPPSPMPRRPPALPRPTPQRASPAVLRPAPAVTGHLPCPRPTPSVPAVASRGSSTPPRRRSRPPSRRSTPSGSSSRPPRLRRPWSGTAPASCRRPPPHPAASLCLAPQGPSAAFLRLAPLRLSSSAVGHADRTAGRWSDSSPRLRLGNYGSAERVSPQTSSAASSIEENIAAAFSGCFFDQVAASFPSPGNENRPPSLLKENENKSAEDLDKQVSEDLDDVIYENVIHPLRWHQAINPNSRLP